MRTLDEIRVFLKEDHFAFDLCGIVIEAVGDGTARCSMKLEKKHLNANGVVQGGAIFTLADICFCVAANSAGGRHGEPKRGNSLSASRHWQLAVRGSAKNSRRAHHRIVQCGRL